MPRQENFLCRESWKVGSKRGPDSSRHAPTKQFLQMARTVSPYGRLISFPVSVEPFARWVSIHGDSFVFHSTHIRPLLIAEAEDAYQKFFSSLRVFSGALKCPSSSYGSPH